MRPCNCRNLSVIVCLGVSQAGGLKTNLKQNHEYRESSAIILRLNCRLVEFGFSLASGYATACKLGISDSIARGI